LTAAVENELSHRGSALILDCHSFPSAPLAYELDQDPDRPDICLGTDAFHTPSALIESARQAASKEGFTCQINRPFSGTVVPNRYLEKDKRIVSIRIEVNRSLYMDEDSAERSYRYDECKASLARIIETIRMG
jgi:N-formylglutamate amidohydrolase